MRRLLWLVLVLCSSISQAREMADNSAISNFYCMATAIYFEARGEPLRGKVAVRDVINNRGADTCSVVFERRQFSFTHEQSWKRLQTFLEGNPKLSEREQKAWEASQKAVSASFVVLPPGYKHYHRWNIKRKWTVAGVRIGQHTFMKGVKYARVQKDVTVAGDNRSETVASAW